MTILRRALCYPGLMSSLELPRDLTKGAVTRTATTPSEYHDLRYKGFEPVDGEPVASKSYDELTPAQKAARTRAEHKAAQEQGRQKTASQNPDVDPDAQSGTATPSNPDN